MTVRVGVADDQPLIRAGLRAMIDHVADLELVGEACDGEQAVELAEARGRGAAVWLLVVGTPQHTE